jgi:predicted nucleic acid-binding protein
MSIVIDASALVRMLLRRSGGPEVLAAVEAGDAYAPEMLDAEVLSALARLERRREATTAQVTNATRALVLSPITRISHRDLVVDTWARRGNHSLYDAFYVALAARLGCPLLTADRRLAAAPGLDIAVTLLPSPDR